MAEPRRLRGEVADAPEREPTLRRRVHHRRRPEKKSSGGYGTRADHSVGFSQVLKLGHGQRASPLLADFGMNVPSWVPGEPKRSKAHRPALPLRARRSFPTTSPSPFAFRRGSFFGKAAGAGAGWGNSLTPSRGARQEEEEPPVPLLPSSDFAGEEEEKEGFCRVWLGEGEQDRGGQRRGRILGRSWGWKGRGGGGGSLMVEPVQCGECRYGKIKVFYTNTLGLREVGVTLLKPASLSYPSTAGLGTPPRLHRGRTAWGTPRIPRTCEQPRARSSLLLLANSKGITWMFFKLKVS